MASKMLHFPTFSYVIGKIKVKLSLRRLSKQFAKAQQWLGNQVLEDSKNYMPYLTGSLQDRSCTEDDGRRVIYPGPYARFLYMGKVMVDPETGSAWGRRGVKKVVTDRPIHYSRPEATDHWFDTAKAQYGEAWIAGVKKIAGGGK